MCTLCSVGYTWIISVIFIYIFIYFFLCLLILSLHNNVVETLEKGELVGANKAFMGPE